ncbi:MAG TPA: hypothetical protein DDX33_05955 [Rikenellaceae bacterium]|nr:hypothetical protein [Rikenellaceae bacterium]
MKRFFMLFAALIVASSICAGQNTKARLFVLTDVENEPDDSESLVRLMLYSNVIDIEGICATTSVHMKTSLHPQTIISVIDAYEKVRPNLLLHEPGFPTAEYLRSIVYEGQSGYGVGAIGKSKRSAGSDAIVRALLSDDPRPLWVTAWGGVNTLAQALETLRTTRTSRELKKILSKLRVYTISDQDDSGIWIRKNFPEVFYIVSPGGYGASTWSGMMDSSSDVVDNSVISNKWIAENIQQGHGPLGAVYPDVAYGIEGDTPSWLGLIPVGLADMEHPDWGGWGGRYEYYKPLREDCDLNGFNGGVPIEEEPHAIWTNAVDTYYPYVYNEYGKAVRRSMKSQKGYKVTLYRWREDYQWDMAARMDWCVKSYDQANHPPVPVLKTPKKMTVHSGEFFLMDASDSYDPDGDSLSYLWFNYPEAGTMEKEVPIQGAENIHFVRVKAPEVTQKETLHFILRLSDKGTPSLCRYERIIVEVLP